jgi:hypothetical protein
MFGKDKNIKQRRLIRKNVVVDSKRIDTEKH